MCDESVKEILSTNRYHNY